MRRSTLFAAVAGAVLAAGASACAGILGDFKLGACAPDTAEACPCADGSPGERRCSKDGAGFGECACPSLCGNGMLDPGECTSPDTLCAADCCGNGTVDPGECMTAQSYCIADCCGDGIAEPGECGTDMATTMCPPDCAPTCGDNLVQPGECDTMSADYCAEDCCDPKQTCASVLMGGSGDTLCPGNGAYEAWQNLLTCLCSGKCAMACSSNLCSGQQMTPECQTCTADVMMGCGQELDNCSKS